MVVLTIIILAVCYEQVLSAVDDATWRCDVWSQIGHVYELKRDVPAAKSSYMKALDYNQVHYILQCLPQQ
jgi:hypothetical protein